MLIQLGSITLSTGIGLLIFLHILVILVDLDLFLPNFSSFTPIFAAFMLRAVFTDPQFLLFLSLGLLTCSTLVTRLSLRSSECGTQLPNIESQAKAFLLAPSLKRGFQIFSECIIIRYFVRRLFRCINLGNNCINNQ